MATNKKSNTNNIPETIMVEPGTKTVMCDGGDGALGHPAVYYSFDGNDFVECGYCDRRFEIRKDRKSA